MEQWLQGKGEGGLLAGGRRAGRGHAAGQHGRPSTPVPICTAVPSAPSLSLCVTPLCVFFCSNPKVQIEAIEGGALQKLLVIVATEQPQAVKKKVSRHGSPLGKAIWDAALYRAPHLIVAASAAHVQA